jgi:hypothetical protein
METEKQGRKKSKRKEIQDTDFDAFLFLSMPFLSTRPSVLKTNHFSRPFPFLLVGHLQRSVAVCEDLKRQLKALQEGILQ